MMFDRELADLRREQAADRLLFAKQLRRTLRAASPRRLLRKHPYASIAGAAVLGFLVAPSTGRGTGPERPSKGRFGAMRWLVRLFRKRIPFLPDLMGGAAGPVPPVETSPGPMPAEPRNTTTAVINGIMALVEVVASLRGSTPQAPADVPTMQCGNAGSIEASGQPLHFSCVAAERKADMPRANKAS